MKEEVCKTVTQEPSQACDLGPQRVDTQSSNWSLWEPRVAPAKKCVKLKKKKEEDNSKTSSGYLNEMKRQLSVFIENRRISQRLQNSKPIICIDNLERHFQKHKMLSKNLSNFSSVAHSRRNSRQSIQQSQAGAYHQLNFVKMIKNQKRRGSEVTKKVCIATPLLSSPLDSKLSPNPILFKTRKEQCSEALRKRISLFALMKTVEQSATQIDFLGAALTPKQNLRIRYPNLKAFIENVQMLKLPLSKSHSPERTPPNPVDNKDENLTFCANQAKNEKLF